MYKSYSKLTLYSSLDRLFENRMKFLLNLVLLLTTFTLSAQVKTTALVQNKTISTFLDDHPNYQWKGEGFKTKWGTADTLSLPFFDEFTNTGIYPDSTLWLNNQVYVNRHFGDLPPTLGVATFDVLDNRGQPYNNGTLNKDFTAAGDSLTSMPINLEDSAGQAYSLSDSFVLSFFYQPNGLGYHLEAEDSLRLFFKNEFDVWIQVWSAGGSDVKPFEYVSIPVDQPGYLHKGFQFMFTTWTRQVGNANHWHIDYVLLDKDRSVQTDYFEDYAIQSRPSSLLRSYYEMPLSHFLADPQNEVDDSIYFRASNLDQITLNIEVRHQLSYQGTTLANTAFAANAGNVPSRNSSRRRFEMVSFDAAIASGSAPLSLDRITRVREAGVINKNTANDSVFTQQMFWDYFAHDDGSAEQGFGFDQDINPTNIEGEIAYRFKLNHADTLFAIAAFFNQAVFDVSRETFTFRVWKQIAGQGGASADSLVYESEPLNPMYMDRINQFSVHYLDTQLVLPAGDFYIGWWQNSMFNLNMGWDKNAGNHKTPAVQSTDLFYKVFGSWSNANLPEGELMLRPYVGSSRTVFASVPEQKIQEPLTIYPNPSNGSFQLGQEFEEVMVYDLQGNLVHFARDTDQLTMEAELSGMFYVLARNSGDQWLKSKVIIFADK